MIDCIVVGGGHAGLAASWHLRNSGIDHVVLEQGRVGESWRSQRWDTFQLNTPAWATQLPGAGAGREPPDSFLSRDVWVGWLEEYARTSELPVREGVRVTSLSSNAAGGFLLRTESPAEDLRARAVVLASGFQRVPKLPELAASVPPSVTSIHAAEYRRPEQLPPGAVLVVGSAQSGGQIAEDLLDAGRTVYVSASAVGRMPRRYRGRDIFEWLAGAGFFDQSAAQLPNPRMQFAAQPIISGVGRYGHTLSLQLLAGRGATLLGRLSGIDGTRLRFDNDLPTSIRTADRVSAEIRAGVDRGIEARGDELPPGHPDPADEPVADPDAIASPAEIDLKKAGVSALVWSTGFTGDLSWVDLDVKDARGAPIQEGGRSPVPGVWFLGVPWQRSRKSGIILGGDQDGAAVAEEVSGFLRR